MRQRHIKPMMIFWFLVIGLVPLVVGISLFFANQVRTIKKEKSNQLVSIRQLKVFEVNNWLMEREGDLHVMSGDYEIRGLENILSAEMPGRDAREKISIAEELLNRYKRNLPDYETLSILDPETGVVRISTDQEYVGLNFSDEAYFSGVLEGKGVFIQDIHNSSINNIPVLTMAIPITCLSHNEHIIGILVTNINLHQSFYPLLLMQEGLGKTGETLIVNSEAIAVSELRWYNGAPLKLKIDAEPALRAAGGESGTVIARDYRGENVLAAYTHISRTGWGFVSKQDLSELYVPVYRTIWVFLIILLFSVGLVLLAALYISRLITRPIERLTGYAKKIKSGDGGAFQLTEAPEEILQLADVLNHTTTELNTMLTTRQSVFRFSQHIVGERELTSMAEGLLSEIKSELDCQILAFYQVNQSDGSLIHLASIGLDKKAKRSIPEGEVPGEIDAAITEKKIQYIREKGINETFIYGTIIGDIIPRELITIPVMDEDNVVGIITLINLNRFPEEMIQMLEEFRPMLNASFTRQLVTEKLKRTSFNLRTAYELQEVQSEELREQTEELEEQTEELQEMAGELKKQNKVLQQKSREAEESSRLKSEFLSNVSHELRTPLNSILTLSKLLTEKKIKSLNEKQQGYLQTIERNGRGLLYLINDILDLSKIEAGKVDIRPEKVLVNQLIQYVYESLEPMAAGKKISLVMETNEQLPSVITDRVRLRQILYNLVNNAIKFTDKGSVKIRTEFTEEHVVVRVKDTGIGISEKFKPYMFEQFTQADASTARRFEGTGLGLSIVKNLADLLHISIHFESNEDDGSEFVLEIPLLSKFEQQVFQSDLNSELHAKKVKIAGKHILLIEDNPEAIIQLQAVLEKAALKVMVAESGERAIQSIGKHIPDGIILDLMMPGMDGFEVLNRIRNRAETAEIPVLVLTAKDLSKKDLAKLNDNHVFKMIQKGDVDVSEMMEVIQKMLTSTNNEVVNKREKIKVLIVEEQIETRITLRAMLDDIYELVDAEDARTAIKLASIEKPDIILMSLNLPGLGGKDAMKVLKKNKDTAQIPVVGMQAGDEEQSEHQLKKQGFVGILDKPVVQDRVLALLRTIMNN